jgi:hypothetical protein
MTTGPDPTRREQPLPAGRERGFAGRRDADEPRFAGPPGADRMPSPAPPWSTESTPATQYPPPPPYPPPPSTFPAQPPPAPLPWPPAPTGFDPVVEYGAGVPFPAPVRNTAAMARIGAAIAATGGVLAGVGSLFTWATLRLTDSGTDSQGFSADPSTITYNGLSLLEGRIMLVLGLLVIAVSCAALARRPHRLLGPALAACGGLAVVVMAFAAIGHPVELATLFRSYSQIDAVKVSLPNGAGIWLAVVGALLILAGGLLVVLLGRERQGEGQE